MTSSQEQLVNIYGWSSLGVLIAFFVIFFGSSSLRIFSSLFRNTYTASGAKQNVDFSSNPDIPAYVPQIKLPSFPFPLLACDIDAIYQELIGWNDEAKSYDHYNLIFDVPYEGMKRTKMIEENTRGKGQIQDHEDFRESTNKPKTGPEVGPNGGVEVREAPKPIFSIMKHYPPSWLQKILDEENRVTEE
jgi:hypothetical protein